MCDNKPLKSEPFNVSFVVSGDKLDYTDDPGSPATPLIENKLLLNITNFDKKKG